MAVTLDSLKKAIKKNKGRSQALAWLADMERASGDYDAALKLVDDALAAFPSDVPAMLVRAKVLAGMQDYAGSIAEYKKILSKDPFCLSAHKRMGESFDKLGKVAERNACFRRVHDMDPLDPFWKDEYDVLPEEQQDGLVAPPMDDSSFTMDVDSEPENAESNGEDNIFANLAASLPNSDEEDNSAMDALRSSLDSASDENSTNFDAAQDAGFDGHALNSSEVSSAISDILGGDDDLETSESSNDGAANPSPFSHMDFSDEDDAPKADESIFSLDDAPAEPAAPAEENAQQSEATSSDDDILSLDDIDADEHSTNVDDAFSSLLGDDELPEEPVEKSEEPKTEEESESQGGLFEKSADADFSLDGNSEEKVEAEEDKATNVDDAFSSIFGDDELPEESVDKSEESKTEEESESSAGLFEKSADADFSLDEAPAEPVEEHTEEPAPSDVILKEPDSEFTEEKSEEPVAEELVAEEQPADEQAAEEQPAEKQETVIGDGSIPTTHMDFSDEEDLSSDDKVFDLEEPPAEEKSDAADIDLTLDEEPAEAPAEEKPVEEELAEAPVEEAPAESEAVAPVEEAPAEDVSLELSDEERGNGSVPSDHMDFSDEELMPEEHDPELKIDNTPLTLDDDAPIEEKSVEEQAPAEESPVDETPAEAPVEEISEKPGISEDLSVSVDGAFDALFGDDEDDAPAESTEATPIEETPVEESPIDAPAEETSAEETPVDVPVEEKVEETPVQEEPVAEAPADAEPAEEKTEESNSAESAEDNLAKEMGGAFASMFGDDDDLDLPEEKSETTTDTAELTESSAEEPLSQESTSAELEEQSVKDGEFKLESASDFVANESESSSSLFEKSADADFTLNDSSDEPAEKAEVPSAELDSIDSEVSNAFKGLFDEDDSLPESDEPSNKGVDYLMSGDSDDEVSASLVNDADAPLSRGAADLDDSLNTRTLADIYMEQGVYNKALEIYSDLAKKNPDNEEIKSRLEEVQKLCREKFGEN